MMALVAVLISATLRASPVIFQYATTIDTTDFGGGPGTPLVVTYEFDSALADGSGPVGPIDSTSGSYGPLTMQIQLGGETVSAAGGGISVFDNAGSSIIEDSYDVRPDDDSFSGQLLGRDVGFFRFLIVDSDRNMFNSTALPLSPDFATAADYQQVEFDFADGSELSNSEGPEVPLDQRTPFTLTAVPEPSSIALLALGGLAFFGRQLITGKNKGQC